MKYWIVFAGLTLAGCATAPAPRTTIIRADGQTILNNPALLAQAELDKQVCRGEMQKANLSGVTVANGGLAEIADRQRRQASVSVVGQGCMASKGYLYVPEAEAQARREELAHIHAGKKN